MDRINGHKSEEVICSWCGGKNIKFDITQDESQPTFGHICECEDCEFKFGTGEA